MSRMKYHQVRVEKELYVALTKLKLRDGVPIAESIRRAIIEYLEKKEIKLSK